MAEAIFNHKIRERGLDNVFEADSCGTGNYHIGDQPDPRTIANAKKNKVAISHCARQLSSEDLDRFDYVLAMDSSNLQNILRLSNSHQHAGKICLMRESASNNLSSPRSRILWLKIASAIGERQMLPRQTKSILFFSIVNNPVKLND